ncbi:uncharacterized protein K441DRAFT_620083 [Cenococcum geophilum 1.58]|uniref:uncharacterized protein n=1 Tax=Cenococcum geophilum 1.58 TaxID=794803 RepID=UPI00358FF71E|nr:hypothetical protein K441DRAFT_620083 [Cenococcum geophilum 1.58]
MTDYNKLTVANLRQLLKDRQIPSTGLTRKAQIIQKLKDADQSGDSSAAPPDTAETSASSSHTDDASAKPSEQPEEPAAQHEAVPGAPILNTSETQATETTIAPDALAAGTPKEQPLSASSSITIPVEETATLPASTQSQSAPDASASVSQPAVLSKETQSTQPSISTNPDTQPHTEHEAQTVEATEPLPTIVEADTSVEVSRLNSEELEADTRKRKRRSETPDVQTQDIKSKKLRQSEELTDVVHLKEDYVGEDVVMEDKAADAMNLAIEDKKQANGPALPSKPSSTPPRTHPAREKDTKDARYKSLFHPTPTTTTATAPETPDDRPIPPSLHPATPALYIRNFMRPLQPSALRTHLIALASPPASPPDSSILTLFYLDPIRTHALALFTTTTAAARVRAALHDAVWPLERDRRPLWVDFVPEERVEAWIEREEDGAREGGGGRRSGGGGGGRRWEVVYVDAPEGVRAVFQEVGARGGGGYAMLNPARAALLAGAAPGVAGAPLGPREGRRFAASSSSSIAAAGTTTTKRSAAADKSFATLDTLFRSTTAKPKLYFLPVDATLAARRLEALSAATARDWRADGNGGSGARGRGRGRGGGADELRRFGFEGDRIVDVGPDFGGRGGAGVEARREREREDGGAGVRGGGRMRGGGDSWRGGGFGGGERDRDRDRERNRDRDRGGRGRWRGR